MKFRRKIKFLQINVGKSRSKNEVNKLYGKNDESDFIIFSLNAKFLQMILKILKI